MSDTAAQILNKPKKSLKIITCHLGNGSSIAAVKNGESIDTSMGFTPLEGLLMGTRSGDIDPAVVLHIMNKEEMTMHEMNTLLNKHSGIQGLSGLSSDMREIEQVLDTNDQALLAHQVFCYRLKKYIGAYIAAMNGVDAIVFTGGIGENSSVVRRDTLKDMQFLGIDLDSKKNNKREKVEREIQSRTSKVKILIIPTNEELVIARDTMEIVKNLKKKEKKK